MKSLFALCLSVFLFASSALAQGVYGNWALPLIVSGPLSIQSTISIAENSVGVTVICSMMDQKNSARVAVPATVTSSQITTLGSAHDGSDNGVECYADIEPGTMDYVLSADGNQLTLSMPGEAPITLNRQ